MQNQPQPLRNGLAVDVEKKRDEQGQQEHQHTVGDTKQQAQSAFYDDTEIRPQRFQHDADIGRPTIPQIAKDRTQQGDVEYPERGVGQSSAKSLHHDMT